jgi:hypothetical protein
MSQHAGEDVTTHLLQQQSRMPVYDERLNQLIDDVVLKKARVLSLRVNKLMYFSVHLRGPSETQNLKISTSRLIVPRYPPLPSQGSGGILSCLQVVTATAFTGGWAWKLAGRPPHRTKERTPMTPATHHPLPDADAQLPFPPFPTRPSSEFHPQPAVSSSTPAKRGCGGEAVEVPSHTAGGEGRSRAPDSADVLIGALFRPPPPPPPAEAVLAADGRRHADGPKKRPASPFVGGSVESGGRDMQRFA